MGFGLRFLLVAHHLREAGSVDVPGAQHIDADIAPLQIQDPTARKRAYCRLRGVIYGE